MPKITLEYLNAHYKVVPTSLYDLPKDLSEAEPGTPLEGDCQTYARTVRNIEGRFAIQIRCWSPQNLKKAPYVPRHAVLWVKGKGFIDSTRREYRATPLPHIPAWPVGSLLILAAVQIGEALGFWPGLFALAAKTGLL